MEQSGRNKFSLTEGSILSKLTMVALPIIGTQIILMTYNLTDMFWLGRVGSVAVAASGTVGMYMWLSNAFMMFGRMGAEIGVSQNLGAGKPDTARIYSQSALLLSAILGTAYCAVVQLFKTQLVGFFNIQEAEVVAAAETYLRIVSIGIPFSFISNCITGIFNGSGNSRIPFVINCSGLIINVILDPILIFRFDMGVGGAAIATVIAQVTASLLSLFAVAGYKKRPFADFKLIAKPDGAALRQIYKWTLPIAVESFLFTFLSMLISRLVAAWGSGAMAAQRIGSQIESLCWLISGGYSSALTAFVGQNYGAGKWTRIHSSFRLSAVTMACYGAAMSLLLFFGGGFIFRIFLPDEIEVIRMGVGYLRILALCQIPGCLEGVSVGLFRGMGKTIPPSIVSASSNAARVAAAYLLTFFGMGIDGVWWAISIGATVRGLWTFAWYLIASRGLSKVDYPAEPPALFS